MANPRTGPLGPPLTHPDTGNALDAAQAACIAAENDPAVTTVGYGGFPDSAGDVSLDASIMLAPDRCGAVACIKHYKNPVTLARLVMEHTGHVMLAGEGAERLAKAHNLPTADLLTDRAKDAYQKWIAEHPDEVSQRRHHQPSNFEESSLGSPTTTTNPSRTTATTTPSAASHLIHKARSPAHAPPAGSPSNAPAGLAIRPSSATACTSIRNTAPPSPPAQVNWSWASAAASSPSKNCGAATHPSKPSNPSCSAPPKPTTSSPNTRSA